MKRSEVKYILKWAKKIKAINLLGGKCYNCGESDIYVLDFHHKDEEKKEFQITLVGLHKKWSLIEPEVKKCILLCRNCHMKKHNQNKPTNTKKIKKQILQYKGGCFCSECKYQDPEGISLDLHHVNPKNKTFGIAQETRRTMGIYSKRSWDFTENILKELDKCIVLCRNCHVKKHIDMNLQNKLMPQIMEKVCDMTENQRLNHHRVWELRKQGLTLSEISRKLGYKKEAVNYVIYYKKHP